MSKAKGRRPAQPGTPAKRLTVSACLIVKNEEANLARCLNSLRGVVDEVIVVDTGSTDGTVAIAQEHGARIVHFAWCNDFAAARNESIRHAKGDWLVWIDADEELVEEPKGALRKLCERPEQPEGFLLRCRNLMNEKGDVNSVIQQWRLFRNGLGLRFDGRIHEHLTHPDGRVEAYLLFQDHVWIRHWGYLPEPQLVARKRKRNHELLALALQDNPEDPFVHYNIGKQHVAAYDFAPALPELRRAIELWQAQGSPIQAYVGNMLALAINAAVELRDNQLATEIEALVPGELISPDILFQAGIAWWRLGHTDRGVERLNRAWQDTSIRRSIEGDPGSFTWRPLAALAQIALDRGDPQQAYELALKAHAHAPDLPNLLYALALSTATLKRYDQALDYARRLLTLDVNDGYKRQARRLLLNVGQGLSNPSLVVEGLAGPAEGIDEPSAVLLLADAHGALGDVQAQYDALQRGCDSFPEHLRIRLALAEVLDNQGFLQQAVNVLGAAMDQPEPELYRRLAMALTKLGRLDDAANALAVLEKLLDSGRSLAGSTA